MDATKYHAEQAARQFAVAQLRIAFPRLVPVSDTTDRLVAAAKNIRIELKAAFPSVKFSVKTERYSMGNSLRVRWTDGPTVRQVEEITMRYSAGDFDGMTDCYNYRKDHAWPEAFGAAKYIFTNRDLSPELAQKAIDHVWEKFHMRQEKITPEGFDRGEGMNMQVSEGQWSTHWTVQNQVYEFTKTYDATTGTVIED